MISTSLGISRPSGRVAGFLSHFASAMTTKPAQNGPDVGIIVIGDEILKGHVQDTNSHFLCRKLFSLGVQVKKVSMIPDDLDTIAQEVREFSSRFTHVITSGGIGPTHDDITFEGVARAFGESVVPHPELVTLCKKYFGTDDLKSPKLKMAHVPQSATLHYGIDKKTGERAPYPLVNVKNVYVFPGIPSLLERAFINLDHLFKNPNAEFHVREMYINADEVAIANVLNDADAKFRGRVILGSYPEMHSSYFRVKLTLEAQNAETVEEAYKYLESHLPPGSVMSYEKDPVTHADEQVYGFIDKEREGPLVEKVRQSVEVIEEAFDKYRLEEICIGFNGGKDCTAILHLVYAVYKRKYPGRTEKLKALYIRRGQPFPELELFIQKSARRYRLELITLNGRIREAMGHLPNADPSIKAVIMGTRKSDPHSSHLEPFNMTDPNWPQYMRVNPILGWTFSDVWTFLRSLSLQYCSLYDRGYTSLGSMENTHPNPSLQQIDDRGSVTYRPAYQLEDQLSERAGRN